MSATLGAFVANGRTRFAVRSPKASAVDLCLFDGDRETRCTMERQEDNWIAEIPGDLSGASYGFRADGRWDPLRGFWFDKSKLLVDPFAKELDRRFIQRPELAQFGADTAAFVPRTVVQSSSAKEVKSVPPLYSQGGLIYELNVRSFTILHPEVPERHRGTIAALAHPSVIKHFQKLYVSAIELMPIVAWIDERHLPPLGLRNSWGYNPVVPMALDPGLCPGGLNELRNTVSALHAAGIGVILDLVFNHTGESDDKGGILSLRGLDNEAYAHEPDGRLVNVTGTGNTLNFAASAVRELTVETLRHFVRTCGIDGFRFDLATVLARGPTFDEAAPIFEQIAMDPFLADRIMIAEPWDIGQGGYRLGQFPSNWLEWNDLYRDDVRRFWRGDLEVGIGKFATRIAGSSDIFGEVSRSVNYLAAHDGMTLADVTSYEQRHNEANGEENRDGQHENFSWNCGIEGPSDEIEVRTARQCDGRALLGTLFASFGPIMLTAGDEFGRSQRGNNNAYCQDNEITWLDWVSRDVHLEEFVVILSSLRSANLNFFAHLPPRAQWLNLDDQPLSVEQWEDPLATGFKLTATCSETTLILEIDRARRTVKMSPLGMAPTSESDEAHDLFSSSRVRTTE